MMELEPETVTATDNPKYCHINAYDGTINSVLCNAKRIQEWSMVEDEKLVKNV